MKNIILMLQILFLSSCTNQISFNPVVEFINDSDLVVDSVIIQDLLDKKTILYNIKPHTRISKTINIEGEYYPSGDYFAFDIFVFRNDTFYRTGHDIIDIPFTKLKKKYTYYFWKEGAGYLKDSLKIISKPVKINKENLKQLKFYYEE